MGESKVIEQQIEMVANFMGMKKDAPNVWSDMETGNIRILGEYSPNKDWNELMPVVEKVSNYKYPDKYNDYAYPRTFGMKDIEGDYMVRFNRNSLFTARTPIEATWLAVVDFIQWFNTQSSNTENK